MLVSIKQATRLVVAVAVVEVVTEADEDVCFTPEFPFVKNKPI